MLKTLHHWGIGTVLLLLACTALAGGPREVRKQAEASMTLTGQIDIAPDGSVEAVTLDQQDRISEGVARFVHSSVMGWAFEPVVRDGRAVGARTPLLLRLVGKPLEDGGMRLSIGSASFSTYDPRSVTSVTRRKMTPPTYPSGMYERGVQGEVYLILKVGRDGNVVDAHVEQVNMTVVASEGQMQQFRRGLGNNALAAARKWQFNVPVEGPEADQPYWKVRVPVNYAITDHPESEGNAYGKWRAYIPGPRERASWISDDEWENGSDALAQGGVYMAGRGNGPKLLTALEG